VDGRARCATSRSKWRRKRGRHGFWRELAPRRRAGKGQMRMPPAVFASGSTRRIRTRPCNGRRFIDGLLGPEFMRTLALSAGRPTPAPREPSPGIRASLLTQAKFLQHERSCRSPRGDTQLLRFSASLVSTFYPPGHCYAQVRSRCTRRFKVRIRGKFENAANGAIKQTSVAAWKIGARRAVVWHKQRVPTKAASPTR
jgi:hypothetical protein